MKSLLYSTEEWAALQLINFLKVTYIKFLNMGTQTVGEKLINEYKGYLRELLAKMGHEQVLLSNFKVRNKLFD